MKNVQQEEALRYFRTHAQDWQNKAKASGEGKVNVIQQRNGYVLEIIKDRKETRSILDVGCGTGDLVCDVAKQGIDATGVDFAQDMIELALDKAKGEQLKKAHFECCSIFDFDSSKHDFDVISANGFIQYISQDELNNFFDIVYHALNPNGSFVVGSRNRLFNLFSLNAFTRQELNEPSIEALLRESVALASGDAIEEISRRVEAAPLQKPDTQHTKTGIDVTTRFQYTPLQLMNMLNDRGFESVEIYPIHIHSAPPLFKDKHPEMHASISNLLQVYARQCSELVPFSSSFMLHVQKGK
ncbi:class I SAM-dependent methyltransferase [Planctomycetota bacterium]